MKHCFKNSWLKLLLLGGAIIVAASLGGTVASATPLANDPFLTGSTPANGEYAVGALGAQNPSVFGFSGAWSGGGTVTATNLIYSNPNYTASSGGSISTTSANRWIRSLNSTVRSALSTTADGTVYLSIVAKFGGGSGSWGYAAFELGTSGIDAQKALAVGIDNSVANFMYQINNGTKTSLGVVKDTATHLFLVKFVLSSTASSDAVTIWIDPVLGGAGDPTGGVTATGLNVLAMNDFSIGSGAAANSFDEIRIGTTLLDVTTPPANTPPSIAQAPISATRYLGQNVNFSVTLAANAQPPAFQWMAGVTGGGIYTNLSNGSKYSGATSSTLTVSNLDFSDALDFVVVVTNVFGSVTSSPAILTVSVPQDELISADCSQAGTPNQTDAAVLGAPGDVWNEFRSGAGATYSTIFDTANTTLPNVSVAFSNSGGSGVNNNGTGNNTGGSAMDSDTTPLMQDYVYKNGGTLQVTIQNLDAFVGRQFGLVLFCSGDQAGQGPTNIVMLSGGSGGNTLSNLTVTAATRKISDGTGVAFNYYYGTLTTNTLTVQLSKAVDYLGFNGFQLGLYTNQFPAPSIVGQPQPFSGFEGNTVALSGQAVSFGSLGYQWQAGAVGGGVYTNVTNGGNVSGATTRTLTITGATAAQALDYVLVVTNSSGGTTSQVATVTLSSDIPPQLTVDTTPSSLTRYTGATVTFNALFSGSQPMTNQWQFSPDNVTFTNLPGQTGTNLTLGSITLSRAGYYRLAASNAFGSGTSSAAQLTVLDSANALIHWSSPVPFGSLTVGQIFSNTPGYLMGAINFGGPTIAVALPGQPLTFTADTASTIGSCNGNATFGAVFASFNTTGETNLDQVLDTYREFHLGATPLQITLNNLIEGQTYSVQLFAVDDRGGFSTRPVDFQDANDANDISDTYIVGSNSYLVGTFTVPTGSGGTVTIQENIANDTGINALVLRAISFNPGPSGPEAITSVVSGNTLQLSWTTLGWRLQVQTNLLNTGLGTNWMDVPNSTSVTQTNLPITSDNGAVFYRLVYP